MSAPPPIATATRVGIEIPQWLEKSVLSHPGPLASDEERMALTVALAAENVLRGGGPFGSTVFLGDQLLGFGVNLVLTSRLSIAHAEIVALMHAQTALGDDALSLPALSLFASTEPCCQCFGALIWAGVRRLVCAATTADAEAVGFDEGPKPDAWVSALERRGIAVKLELMRGEGQTVLKDYVARGGIIYGKPRSA